MPEELGKQMKVDITIDDSRDAEPSSVRCSLMFVDWVFRKAAQLPYLVPVVLLLKKLLRMHDLNVPYLGTRSRGDPK